MDVIARDERWHITKRPGQPGTDKPGYQAIGGPPTPLAGVTVVSLSHFQGAVAHGEKLKGVIREAYSLLQQGREPEARARLAAGYYYATPRGQ